MKIFRLLIGVVCLLPTTLLTAQETCALKTLPKPPGNIIFSEQQEMDLGDAIAEQIRRDYSVIENSLNKNLEEIVSRLLSKAPPTGTKVRIFLINESNVNASAFPGGRIYVTTGLVLAAKSEDEIAGVVAHELGHILTRQGAEDFTMYFKQVLGVTSVGDRKDIFEKYHRWVENQARRRSRGEKHEAGEQLIADQIAVKLTAYAGYRPQAYSEFWDRMAETQGDAGSRWGDFFGSTTPEQKRLREMLKMANALPHECGNTGAALTAGLKAWQSAIVRYRKPEPVESLPGLEARRELNPPLRGDLEHIRFSPDGRYLLAQDDASVYVLSRTPFVVLFRAPAENARHAQFTPDSSSVVFMDGNMRVERWGVQSKSREAVDQVVFSFKRNCIQSVLSPTGKVIACFDKDFALSLIDVESGADILSVKSFYKLWNYYQVARLLSDVWENGNTEVLAMGFSRDGRYFAAGRDDSHLAYDFTAKASVKMAGNVKNLTSTSFVFLDDYKIVGVNGGNPGKSSIVKFPTGEETAKLALGNQAMDAPTKGEVVFLRPVTNAAVGVMDIATGKLVMANKRVGFDMYGALFAAERGGGELALSDKVNALPIGIANLPKAPLGRLRAFSASPDFGMIALSGNSRGGAWDLSTGHRRTFTRAFWDAYIGKDNVLLAEYPAEEKKTKHNLSRIDLTTGTLTAGEEITEDKHIEIFENMLLTYMAKDKDDFNSNVTMEFKDLDSGKVLWSRRFPKEVPEHIWDFGHITFAWALDSDGAREEIKQSPELQKQLAAMQDKNFAFVLSIHDSATGQAAGKLIVETGKGSFGLTDVNVAGDRVILSDNHNRVMVYSLAKGAREARFFGQKVAVSGAGNVFGSEVDDGRLRLYDLASLEQIAEYTFDGDIARYRFSRDGTRLLVLTRKQTVYTLKLPTRPAVIAGKD